MSDSGTCFRFQVFFSCAPKNSKKLQKWHLKDWLLDYDDTRVDDKWVHLCLWMWVKCQICKQPMFRVPFLQIKTLSGPRIAGMTLLGHVWTMSRRCRTESVACRRCGAENGRRNYGTIWHPKWTRRPWRVCGMPQLGQRSKHMPQLRRGRCGAARHPLVANQTPP